MGTNFLYSIERHFLKGLDQFKGSVMNEMLLANGLVTHADIWEQKKALVTFKSLNKPTVTPLSKLVKTG